MLIFLLLELLSDIDFLFIFYSICLFTAAQYIAKNGTDSLQQTSQFHQVATSLLKYYFCNLSFADLLQLVEATCSVYVDNKF